MTRHVPGLGSVGSSAGGPVAVLLSAPSLRGTTRRALARLRVAALGAQMRARLRAEATANENNPEYDSPIQTDAGTTKSKGVTSLARLNDRGNFEETPDPDSQRAEFKKRLAETGQGSPTTRRFLSEPPLVYREASATAPVDDVGEPEWKKERRSKRNAKKKGTGGWWPW